ncbi:dual specificity protein phosphatase 14 [Anabrus simplex]|uniref:dual specificity protein phosphatase 14 n=1 Tax=Anabrus simplex TaxID=316456 RepID=UPI0034DCD0A9
MKVIGKEDNLQLEESRFSPKSPAILSSDISDRIQSDQLSRACVPQTQVAEVTDCLLLCGAAAVWPERLIDLGVTCVVSAAPELPDTPLPPGVAFLRVHLEDHPSANLRVHLDLVADTIEQVRKRGGKTLVHCVAGVSRSAALCLGYLVKHYRMPLRKAFAHLRACRPCVRPNAGFFRQLIEYEQLQLGAASVDMVHNAVVDALIPDVYEPEYQAMLWLQQHYGRRLGRH